MQYNDSILLVSRVDGSVFRSADDAKTFEPIQYIEINESFEQINMRSMTYAGNGTFFFGISLGNYINNLSQQALIYKSTDYGLTWRAVFNVTSDLFDSTVFSIKALSNTIIIAGTGQPDGEFTKIFRSEDAGESWMEVLNVK